MSTNISDRTPDQIMENAEYNYYIAIKIGGQFAMSRKRFVLCSMNPFQGQFLSSGWFNHLIKGKNYKNDLWLAVVQIAREDTGIMRKDILQQLKSADPESWKNLTCVSCACQYHWEIFYEDITDASKILRENKDQTSKMISVSLPCRKYGDDRRLNFTIATYYSGQGSEQYSEEENIFRDADYPKDSEVFQVTIQCPSFVFSV